MTSTRHPRSIATAALAAPPENEPVTRVTAAPQEVDAMASPNPPTVASERSVRQASVIGGLGLMVMAALAGFAQIAALDGLVAPGDAAATARDVMSSQATFRLATASLLLVAALDVLVAWALFAVFQPVHSGLSMLAAWFRLAYAAVFTVAIGELLGALDLLSDHAYLSVFTPDQLHALALAKIDAFTAIWDAGLILFGLSLMIVGYLACRSGFLPTGLAVLIGIAGMGYLIDSLITVLTTSPTTRISTVTFLGEFLLAIWLVTRGRRITLELPAPRHDPPSATG